MTSRILRLVVTTCLLVAAIPRVTSGRGQAAMQAPLKSQAVSARATGSFDASSAGAVTRRYCATCHNQRTKAGGLVLDELDLANPSKNAPEWEKVIRKLRTSAMPPAGAPRPDNATLTTFASWLELSLDRAASASPNPGRPTIHRLNRVEYTNVIRDLLGLEIDGESLLPGDDSGYGFDNIADVLSFSPPLLERYMLSAQKVASRALGTLPTARALESYNFSIFDPQTFRLSDDFPAGTRGGAAIRHQFPADGEYIVKITLQRTRGAAALVRGLDVPNSIDVRLDGRRLKVFTLGNTPELQKRERTVTAAAADDADAELVVRFSTTAGMHVLGVTFGERTLIPEGPGPLQLPVMSASYSALLNTDEGYHLQAGIERLDIDGPIDGRPPRTTPGRERLMVCSPGSTAAETPCARRIASTLARRAYRRPVGRDDVAPLLGLFSAVRKKGGSFGAGVQRMLEAVLVDPEFLFRIENDPAGAAPGAVFRVDDIALASRLSFFLWSSIPDDELLELAIRGQLQKPGAIERQVRRMLMDRRSDALIDNFFGQWLGTRAIARATPDPKAFPGFDSDLRVAFETETRLFLQDQLRSNRGALELFTANYTYLNERLARHYGVAHVYGGHFRRVTFGDDRRAGILGQGSVLTTTSYADRTSPVLRGKWILETLLGTPPPPPPPNVPPLEDTSDGTVTSSVRVRMERHRKNPVCATCHSRLDPLGFAFENFDAVGRWRTTDGGSPVDPSGSFPDGSKFDGPATFRRLLLTQSDALVGTLVEKLLTYALGRGLEVSDMPVVREIVGEAKRAEYRWSTLITAVVKSLPFQMKRARS
ncbi:MAG: DUF1592 domain-containing protein [Vicinamibacterales bacterium]